MRIRKFSRNWDNRILGLLAFFLVAAPKTRLVVGGVPLYLIDFFMSYLIVRAAKKPRLPWKAFQPFPFLVGLYMVLVCLSEYRAATVYGTPLASAYMATRFCLAIAPAFVLPKLVTSPDSMSALLKGITVGALFTAALTILYSLPTTRPLVVSTVFRIEFICPETASVGRWSTFHAPNVGIRGRSLLGAATFTSGILGAVWPLVFFARRWLKDFLLWGYLTTIACVVIPVGILMTYGRTAWLSVIVVALAILVFRTAGGRRVVLVAIAGVTLAVHFFGWNSELFMVKRVVAGTRRAIEAPTGGKAERERFLSYSEPFQHVIENPEWIVIGSGRSAERLARRGTLGRDMLVEEGPRATHSAFAINYYSFGMVAAICHLLIFGFGFLLLSRNLVRIGPSLELAAWQVFFASWCGLMIWSLFGHGIAGEPRGSMVFFSILGLTLALQLTGMPQRGSPRRWGASSFFGFSPLAQAPRSGVR